jgi:hypothetical protein
MHITAIRHSFSRRNQVMTTQQLIIRTLALTLLQRNDITTEDAAPAQDFASHRCSLIQRTIFLGRLCRAMPTSDVPSRNTQGARLRTVTLS